MQTSHDQDSDNLSFDSWIRRHATQVSSPVHRSNAISSNPISSNPISSNAIAKVSLSKPNAQPVPPTPPPKFWTSLLNPIRQWLDGIEVKDAAIAHRLCAVIPSQCPFERDVALFGQTWFHIPPLCKLNPVYDEVVALRFRAICYLADVCGEDVTPYC
jgi:Mo-dependent nitrogenase C-terminus